jgi:hypothetical protein
MNERIQELAKQSGAVTGTELTNVIEALVLIGEEEIQAFAELIVKECITQAQSVDQLRGATEDMIHGADIAGLQIAKHFGIKL